MPPTASQARGLREWHMEFLMCRRNWRWDLDQLGRKVGLGSWGLSGLGCRRVFANTTGRLQNLFLHGTSIYSKWAILLSNPHLANDFIKNVCIPVKNNFRFTFFLSLLKIGLYCILFLYHIFVICSQRSGNGCFTGKHEEMIQEKFKGYPQIFMHFSISKMYLST